MCLIQPAERVFIKVMTCKEKISFAKFPLIKISYFMLHSLILFSPFLTQNYVYYICVCKFKISMAYVYILYTYLPFLIPSYLILPNLLIKT